MAYIPPLASHPPQSTSPTLEDLAGSPPLISPSSSSPSQPVPSGPPPADESDDKASPNSRTGLHLRARAKKILAKSTSVIARSEGKATLFEKVRVGGGGGAAGDETERGTLRTTEQHLLLL